MLSSGYNSKGKVEGGGGDNVSMRMTWDNGDGPDASLDNVDESDAESHLDDENKAWLGTSTLISVNLEDEFNRASSNAQNALQSRESNPSFLPSNGLTTSVSLQSIDNTNYFEDHPMMMMQSAHDSENTTNNRKAADDAFVDWERKRSFQLWNSTDFGHSLELSTEKSSLFQRRRSNTAAGEYIKFGETNQFDESRQPSMVWASNEYQALQPNPAQSQPSLVSTPKSPLLPKVPMNTPIEFSSASSSYFTPAHLPGLESRVRRELTPMIQDPLRQGGSHYHRRSYSMADATLLGKNSIFQQQYQTRQSERSELPISNANHLRANAASFQPLKHVSEGYQQQVNPPPSLSPMAPPIYSNSMISSNRKQWMDKQGLLPTADDLQQRMLRLSLAGGGGLLSPSTLSEPAVAPLSPYQYFQLQQAQTSMQSLIPPVGRSLQQPSTPTHQTRAVSGGGLAPLGSHLAPQASAGLVGHRRTTSDFPMSRSQQTYFSGDNISQQQKQAGQTTSTQIMGKPTMMTASPRAIQIIAERNLNPQISSIHWTYFNARYFVIKSFTEDDVFKSIKYSIWSSTELGNRRLNQAFNDASQTPIFAKPTTTSTGASSQPQQQQQQQQEQQRVPVSPTTPVILFFSVNASGHFCGVALMTTSVNFTQTSSVWAQGSKWKGMFGVKWMYVKDVPNSMFRHLRVATNENKPVTNSRDTQEIPVEVGREMLKIFSGYASKTCILEDWDWYDKREMETRSATSSGSN